MQTASRLPPCPTGHTRRVVQLTCAPSTCRPENLAGHAISSRTINITNSQWQSIDLAHSSSDHLYHHLVTVV